MKNIRILAAAMMLAAVLAVSASAQTRPGATTPARPAATTPASTVPAGPLPDTKIAFIDTGAFADEKEGIARYVNAMKSLETEFKPRQAELDTMATRIKTLADEIDKLSAGGQVVSTASIQSKREEAEKLQRDIEYKKKQADADFSKRYQDVVSPISADIGKALDQYAVSQGITMILDISKLAPAVLTANPNMDVTKNFINSYNSTHPATASTGTR